MGLGQTHRQLAADDQNPGRRASGIIVWRGKVLSKAGSVPRPLVPVVSHGGTGADGGELIRGGRSLAVLSEVLRLAGERTGALGKIYGTSEARPSAWLG